MRISAIVVTLLGLLFVSQTVHAASIDPPIARLYIENARGLYSRGQYDDARQLAEIALQFDPSSSDANYLYGLILRRDQKSTRQAVKHFQAALDNDSFLTYQKTDTAVNLALTLVRIGEADRAFGVIESAGAGDSASADLLYALSKVQYGRNMVAEAERAATRGMNLYPDDPRFFGILLSHNALPAFDEASWLDAHESREPAYLRALLSYIQHARPPAERRKRIEQYFRLGGQDPLASALYLPFAAEPGTELDRFKRLGGEGDKALLEMVWQELPEGAARDSFRKELMGLSATLVVDQDRNGYSEETFTVKDGVATSWMIDTNEDGLPEFAVQLDGKIPQSVTRHEEHALYHLTFASYPYVKSVRFTEDASGSQTLFRLLPGRLRYPLYSPETNWNSSVPDAVFPYTRASVETLLTPENVRKLSYQMEPTGGTAAVGNVQTGDGARNGAGQTVNIVPSGAGITVYRLINGNIVEAVQDLHGNGAIDHVVQYRNGEPQSGIRDLDDDGYFEVTEQYVDGSLRLLAVDENDDGTPEFYEDLGPPRVYAWDLNQDGTLDAREIAVGRNRVLREFASGLDGQFDLSIETYRRVEPHE